MVSCQLKVEKWWNDFEVLTLSNDLLEVVLMPGRGGEIHQIRGLQSGLNFFCEGRPDMPDFCTPERDTPLSPADNIAFSNFYTMFPNAGPKQTFHGFTYEFHGDIRMVAWDYRVVSNETEKIVLEMTTKSKELPFQLKRTLTLKNGSARLAFQDEISHVGPANGEKLPFIYGFHPYFSWPLMDRGTQFRVNGQTIFEAQGREVAEAKLYAVESGEAGLVEIYNPALEAAFRLSYDASLLKYTWLWVASRPAENVYLGSLLPCTHHLSGQHGINAAVESGTARWLEPGEAISTGWRIEVDG